MTVSAACALLVENSMCDAAAGALLTKGEQLMSHESSGGLCRLMSVTHALLEVQKELVR